MVIDIMYFHKSGLACWHHYFLYMLTLYVNLKHMYDGNAKMCRQESIYMK